MLRCKMKRRHRELTDRVRLATGRHDGDTSSAACKRHRGVEVFCDGDVDEEARRHHTPSADLAVGIAAFEFPDIHAVRRNGEAVDVDHAGGGSGVKQRTHVVLRVAELVQTGAQIKLYSRT